MKDTDLIQLPAITVRQARYLRRKYHEMARGRFNKAKRDRSVFHYDESEYYKDYIMLEGLALHIQEILNDKQ